ncbi:sulfur carrier protein ThiS [Bacteroides sp. 51]|uniref:sulfur carrier protein ThiS n=1 Tax=Bacteroides sp. 51 TaxID=2302938 RepID=UPI0013D372ED|nr:sulfur carrier protein ThiS [Bacteroides sp. 51]NDV84037.1 sulfur carrier protein ThiS [Bacteroides sp. 51]
MIIYVNQKPYTVEEGITLAAFMQNIGIKPQGVAVAIAYEVIPQKKWEETVLTDKMELMLIHAVSGG